MIRTASLVLVALAFTVVALGCEDHKKNTEQAPGAVIKGSMKTGKKGGAIQADIPDPGTK